MLTSSRCAYDLDFLISRQPHNASRSYHVTRANSPAPNELEYLNVFDIFNFPRLPAVEEVVNGGVQSLNPTTAPDLTYAVPNPDSDWLFHP
jgi:hypothetical protein